MSGSDDGNETSGAMYERVRGGKPALWFLIVGNRALVAAALLGAGYGLLILLGTFGPGSVGKMLGSDPVYALFTPIIIGIIMGVSLVLTFNQLVLSQELGPLGDQHDRMKGSMEFREEVEGIVGEGTSPPEPSRFLRGLVDATEDSARALADAAEGGGDASTAATEYAETIMSDAQRVGAKLEGQQFGEFEVVRSALNYNYSWKIYTGRRLRNRHGDSLPSDALDALNELIDTLQLFGPAREHFKTLYFRWDLINVSRALIYIAVPALAVTAYMILVFEAGDVTGTTAGVNNSLLVVGLALAAGSSPFALFLSYILRIVTIAKWTLAIGPFVLRETDRGSDLDWE